MSTSSGVVYLTAEGRKELKKELDHLLKVIIPEIAQRIKEAKELGDLSENAEYSSAKEDQGFVAGRILEIQSILANAQIATATKKSHIVQVGSTIVVKNSASNSVHEYSIVGTAETNPSLGKISNESPLGKAFLGREKGDEVTVHAPSGKIQYSIMEIK
ncbi:MAG: Transcription elongation factor GreA [Parcubacteria group bacterium GW2011_GWA2_44_12]|nr:MAG: Transcription elongation factor GreA [Parcubacteria group bacterium GW2011_GWA2_44_12]